MDPRTQQNFYESINKDVFVDILGSLLEGIIITDENLNILYANSSFTQVTGYSLEEILGKNPRFLQSGIQDRSFYESMWQTISTVGEWQGEIWNRKKTGETYPQWLKIVEIKNSEVLNKAVQNFPDKAKLYLGTFFDITQRKILQDQLNSKSQFDSLTGLLNRYGLIEFTRSIPLLDETEGLTYAFLLLDIDRFLNINDSLGHDTGDEILRHIAELLKTFVNPGEIVARMGGDEFAIVLKRKSEDIVRAVREIIQNIRQPISILGQELFITTSIGVSLASENIKHWNELIQQADAAMYRARQLGGDKYQFYKREMHAKALERIDLETRLRKALTQQEFVLHYQPQIHLGSGNAIGLEALIRWNNPHLGMVSPAEFIPLAEETGLIVPIGEWVLETACKQAKTWLDLGFPIRIAVNLSMRQFLQKDLVSMVSRTLAKANLPPQFLELEITESFAMGNVETALKKMQLLKNLGICISIDDFGTGYSSLSYLKRLPIDTLKIDRSFIKDISEGPDGAAISKAIIALAHNLNCSVIAEGVEEKEQLLFLLNNECDHVQGFYFSRPLPAEAVEVFLKEKQFPGIIKF